jgi:hypothetical protein
MSMCASPIPNGDPESLVRVLESELQAQSRKAMATEHASETHIRIGGTSSVRATTRETRCEPVHTLFQGEKPTTISRQKQPRDADNAGGIDRSKTTAADDHHVGIVSAVVFVHSTRSAV